MTVSAPHLTPPAPRSASLLEAARELGIEAAARSREIESARALPADLVRSLRAARLFAMGLPAALGGLESDPETIVSVVTELSYADPATGWNVLIGNTSAFLAWLDPTVAAGIVEHHPDPVLAGSMAPLGQGEVVDGGAAYRLTGQWPFASGCEHADWLMGGFVVTENGTRRVTGRGAPEMRVAFFPREQASVMDTWRVVGLQGTGSHDIRVTDLTVPATHTAVPFAAPARHSAPLVSLSPYNILMALLAGYPLGVARRALAELVDLAGRKTRVGAAGRLLEDPVVHSGVLRDDAALYAAHRGVSAALTDVWETCSDGRELTLPQRARVAAATIHAFDVGRDVATNAFRAGGASVLHRDHPLQRCFRDMHAAAQHIAFGVDCRTRVARALLGLPTPPALFQV